MTQSNTTILNPSSSAMNPTQKLLPNSTTKQGKQRLFNRFAFPLNFIYSHASGVKTESLGDLIVEYVGYYNPNRSHPYSVDIDYCFFNDTDIKAVLIHFDQMEAIEAAALNNCIDAFLNGKA